VLVTEATLYSAGRRKIGIEAPRIEWGQKVDPIVAAVNVGASNPVDCPFQSVVL